MNGRRSDSPSTLTDVRKLYIQPTTGCNLHCRSAGVRRILAEVARSPTPRRGARSGSRRATAGSRARCPSSCGSRGRRPDATSSASSTARLPRRARSSPSSTTSTHPAAGVAERYRLQLVAYGLAAGRPPGARIRARLQFLRGDLRAVDLTPSAASSPARARGAAARLEATAAPETGRRGARRDEPRCRAEGAGTSGAAIRGAARAVVAPRRAGLFPCLSRSPSLDCGRKPAPCETRTGETKMASERPRACRRSCLVPVGQPGRSPTSTGLLMTGTLAHRQAVILPSTRASSTARRLLRAEPARLRPEYHFQLAIEAGCNAYAAPLGFIEAGAASTPARSPSSQAQQLRLPLQARRRAHLGDHGSVKRRCGSAARRSATPSTPLRRPHAQYEALRASPRRRRRTGSCGGVELPARQRRLQGRRDRGRHRRVRRADRLPARRARREGEAAKDLVEHPEAKKVYEKHRSPRRPCRSGCARRAVRLQRKRIVIFSAARRRTEEVLAEIRGSRRRLVRLDHGRNAFQRPKAEALKLLSDVMKIYAS